MSNEMAIRLSNGPADELVRVHTESSDWDEPHVRYLLRQRPVRGSTIPLDSFRTEGNAEEVLDFGKVHVCIYADEDHIEIVLREGPTPPQAA